MNINTTTSRLSFGNYFDHFLARIGWRRGGHRIESGLYTLGNPDNDSPVLATANYTLSFDAIRSELGGISCYILVLDTEGVNVWCAAGKGTFSTDGLVDLIESSNLAEITKHRNIIVPQLGAPGISAHEVKSRSGFKVEYGPVRASDIKEYLKTHEATQEMRRVTFRLKERLVLIPVEFRISLIAFGIYLLLQIFQGQSGFLDLSILCAIFAGFILFPMMLPLLPTKDFSSKGFILGIAVALPFIIMTILSGTEYSTLNIIGRSVSILFIAPTITAFLGLNFTGSSTFTSRSGVRKEIFTYMPYIAWPFITGVILAIVLIILKI